MNYSYLIILGLIAFSAQNGFLRNLGELTLTSVTFSSNCVPTVDDKFTYTASFTGTATATPDSKTLTSTVSDGTHDLTFPCTAKKVGDTSIKCAYGSGQIANGEYGVTAVTEETGDTFVLTAIKNTKFEINSNYVALKSTTASTQTVNYKSTSPYNFTITYASALSEAKKPSKVIASATTPKEFTDCTFKDDVVTCTVTKETLPLGEYNVKVINVCGGEENTGITLKAVEEETPAGSSSSQKLSKLAFVLFGLLFL